MSTILTTITQMQAAGLDLDKNSKIEVFNPHIDASERNYLLPVLGKAFYDLLIADLATVTPAETTIALLPYLRKPITWNSYYLFFKKPIGSLSHSGFYKKTFDNSIAPTKYEIEKLQDQLICNADKAIDELILFLLENEENYPDWSKSDFYEQVGGSIIPTAQVFDEYVKINCSGRVFARLKQYRIRAERSLQRVLCTDLYNKVITEIKSNISPEINLLMPYLRACVAFETMATGIRMLNFNYLENGIYIFSASITQDKTAISTAEVKMLSDQWKIDYDFARNELIAYLNDNIADYPEYENSACYSLAPRTLEVRYENDITKKHFGI